MESPPTATTSNNVEDQQPIFREINPDDPNPETTEIESACMQCFKTGSTTLLLTKIPFYKEVVLMSFRCPHCHFENNEVQSAMEIQKQGVRYVLTVSGVEDLNRKIVRSDYTSTQIPGVDLEIPAKTQKGEITTVEGIFDRTIRGLSQDQAKRYLENPDIAKSIDDYIERLKSFKDTFPYKIILEDISGNAFVENPLAPANDPNCKATHFDRTTEQDESLGMYESAAQKQEKKSQNSNLLKPIAEGSWPIEELHGEVFQFNTICHSCKSPCETNMKLTNIPHFKEVVIMATVCDHCGNKTNEVKSGGGIEDQGIRIVLKIDNVEDLSRDVLKSETCQLEIPEIECQVGASALGGRFTTVEGIFAAMKSQLEGNGILFHDSADPETKHRLETFVEKFDDIVSLRIPATLILDDPAGNSYVQSLVDEGTDPKMTVTRYERTFDQNEDLGLNDIKTENY
ncbi:zinc finger protein ZPR1 [Episyrphus balteatus]|uniref:zinc finger protein ZPR1 n=1 Tax=Episyrphus balteatus TaxID=286459 RepID=UPI002485E8FD|nr:zinc finger protein ZPR1 [Episyrphus balteatus]